MKEVATQPRERAVMDNSLAIAGRATLTAEPINGVRKELIVVTRRIYSCFLLLAIFI
jgi:hypothetical protein